MVTSSHLLARHSEEIRKIFGGLMILSALMLAGNLDLIFSQLAVRYFPSATLDNNALVTRELKNLRQESEPFLFFTETMPKQLRSIDDLPVLGNAPEFIGIVNWINTKPLSIADLHGKVTLIDFWTYSCINCIRTFPYLKDWDAKYRNQGLVIVGVHTPEFEFEKETKNVMDAAQRFGLHYPIAQDNQFETWKAYHNNYWPAHYLIDQNGKVREVHFGEGAYFETENAIRLLLHLPILAQQKEKEAARPITPETYLGYERAKRYASTLTLQPDKVENYTFQLPLEANRVGIEGKWLSNAENIRTEEDYCVLAFNYQASEVYLVLTGSSPKSITVYLDGEPIPTAYQTTDMNSKGEITVKEDRKYDIAKGPYGRHTVMLVIPKGISAYAFTFGG